MIHRKKTLKIRAGMFRWADTPVGHSVSPGVTQLSGRYRNRTPAPRATAGLQLGAHLTVPACEGRGLASNLCARLPRCDFFHPTSGFLMQTPQVRPGLVSKAESMPRIVVFFPNSALGNLAIQLLTQIGIPNDRLGVTPPEQIEGGQGMILSIGCPDEASLKKVESLCRRQGGRIHRQRS